MQHLWNTSLKHYTCNNAGFKVRHGNRLKYAVNRNFDDFIDDVTILWKLDLNRIDPSDGRTALDYIEAEQRRYKGRPIAPTLQRYYDQFRAAGAKHRREIDGSDCTHRYDAERRCPSN